MSNPDASLPSAGDAENIPSGPDGKPLAGKALKKWRRAQKVQSRSGPVQVVPQPDVVVEKRSSTMVIQEAAVPQTVPSAAQIAGSAVGKEVAEQEEVLLGADGKPLTGKALKKARRAALVHARDGPPAPNQPKSPTPTQQKPPSPVSENGRRNSTSSPQQTSQKPSNNPQQNKKHVQQQSKNKQQGQKQNQKPAQQSKPTAPRQRSIFARIQQEFNFTDQTQQIISSTMTENASRISAASIKAPQDLRIGRNKPIKLTNAVHPEFVKLGVKLSSDERSFSTTQRACLELCVALIRYIESFDHTRINEGNFAIAMNEDLKNQLGFLKTCSSFGICLGNIFRYLKTHLISEEMQMLSREHSDSIFNTDKIRNELKSKLTEFMQTRINSAVELIRQHTCSAILTHLKPTDSVLIYKSDPLVLSSLLSYMGRHNDERRRQGKEGKYFTVIVVDDLAHPEGCQAYTKLKALQEKADAFDLQVYYSPVSAVSSIFQRNYAYTRNIKHVLLGCEGILQNGNVLAGAGTAILATFAKHHNIPVTVLCETYKFHEDIQTDIIQKNACISSRTNPLERVLFDMTTSDLISAVITEVQAVLLPTTSIPSLIKDRYGY